MLRVMSWKPSRGHPGRTAARPLPPGEGVVLTVSGADLRIGRRASTWAIVSRTPALARRIGSVGPAARVWSRSGIREIRDPFDYKGTTLIFPSRATGTKSRRSNVKTRPARRSAQAITQASARPSCISSYRSRSTPIRLKSFSPQSSS